MTSMTNTMMQIAVIAAANPDKDQILRHVDAIQIALEMADRPITAEAFVTLSEMIQDEGDVFLRIPEITALGMRAAEREPDSLIRLATKAKAGCRHIRVGDDATLFEISVVASGISSWMAVVRSPNHHTLIRMEDALLDIGRAISGIAITRLTGKVVPAGL